MRPETRQSLLDAKAAAEEAVQLAVSDWHEIRITALAIERLLKIVGEALGRIRNTEPEVLQEITDALKIIGMRNVLVHGYDALDPRRVQDALDKSVPLLIDEISALL